MFLTVELLEKYHAPREIMEMFGEKYPNGIDTILFLDNCQKKINKKKIIILKYCWILQIYINLLVDWQENFCGI